MDYREVKYEPCKLCKFRGLNNMCYELSYIDNVFVEPRFTDINEYYKKGCKTMRKKKLDKLLNNGDE